MLRTLKTLVVATSVLLTGALTAASSTARAVWDTAPAHVTRQVTPIPHVVNLRVGEHATYDRVVLDLTGQIPGYDVRYVSELRYDGSGEQVPLKGTRFIAVRVTPASAHDAQGHSVYRGPQLTQYAMPMLRGVAFTGDYEGHVSFGLALSHQDTFRVFELHSPNRLVIDVHH